jgi:hypothetical protein
MLQTQTIATDTLALLKRLMTDNMLKDFILAGGTNLALQIGHRKSIDLDLFPYKSFETEPLLRHLVEKYKFEPTIIREKKILRLY